MDYNKIEDSVLKKAMETFKQSAVDFFGLDEEIIAPAETEIKNIDIKTNYTDYIFYTKSGDYLHFEFQTTNKRDDIKRFLYYDASLYYKDKRKVRTLVIYSSDIEEADEYIDAGTIKYSIETFYMKNLNGDEILEDLKNKIENNINLTPKDMLSLTLSPLMRGKYSKSSRITQSFKLAQKIHDSEIKFKSISMIYALSEKFMDKWDKNKLKEMFDMTEIGRMIREDGKTEGKIEGKIEGKTEGKTEGKAELLIKQLTKRFGKLPDGYSKKISKLPENTIDIIATDIFELKGIEEIEKYL